MKEGEPRSTKFRQGESAGRPIGGHIADTPFAKTFRALAVKMGLESKFSLSIALKISESAIGTWYRGERAPSSKNFEILLKELEPNDEEREALVRTYKEEISKRRGSGSSFEQSRRRIKHFGTPMSQWIEDFCGEREIGLNRFFKQIGLSPNDRRNRDSLGLGLINKIQQSAPGAFGLSEEERESLSQAVSSEIAARLLKGKRGVYKPRGVLNDKQEKA